MNFDLDDEQRLLDETLRRYFQSDFTSTAVRAAFESPTLAIDQTPWSALASMGIFGMIVPEEHGGTGRGLLDVAVAAECLGYASAPGPFLEHVLATLAIVRGGSESQRATLLPALAAGTTRATLAVAEPAGGWDPTQLVIGGSELRGTKSWVLGGADADWAVVVLDDGLAIVSLDADRVVVEPIAGLDATRRFCSVVLDGPEHERLPGGVAAARDVLDAAAVLLAADAFGGAQRCLHASVKYAQEREQFGTTIAHFQAIKHQLADIALDVEPCRGLYWYAAHAFDRVPGDASRFASLAKAHITDRYLAAARRSIEIHGGIGYTWECDLHIYLRRAVFDRTAFGTPAFHRGRFAELAGWQHAAAV